MRTVRQTDGWAERKTDGRRVEHRQIDEKIWRKQLLFLKMPETCKLKYIRNAVFWDVSPVDLV
jgi:hypothetical protein